MKNQNETDAALKSGLFLGSEPISDIRHRSAAPKDADGTDKVEGDTDDEDEVDEDEVDGDETDESDGNVGDTGDSDGKD